MAFDPQIPTDKDYVRSLIGDTDENNEFLSDGEIHHRLGLYDSPLIAAASCARAIAAKVARDTDYRFSTLWKDASQAHAHFMDLAKDLERRAGQQDTIKPEFVHGGDDPPDPKFERGMHDND